MAIELDRNSPLAGADFAPLGLAVAALVLAGGVLLAAWYGGAYASGLAALGTAAAVALWAKAIVGIWPRPQEILLDAVAIAVLTATVVPGTKVWGVPYAWWSWQH